MLFKIMKDWEQPKAPCIRNWSHKIVTHTHTHTHKYHEGRAIYDLQDILLRRLTFQVFFLSITEFLFF